MNYRSRGRTDHRTRMRSTYNLQQNEGGSPNQSEGRLLQPKESGLLYHSSVSVYYHSKVRSDYCSKTRERRYLSEGVCVCELLNESMCVDYRSEVGMNYNGNYDVNYKTQNECKPSKENVGGY